MIFLYRRCKATEHRLLTLKRLHKTKTLATPSCHTLGATITFESEMKTVRRIPSQLFVTTPEIIGKGQYGVCRKGFLQGTRVCIKILECDENLTTIKTLLHREASILSQLLHPSICFLQGIHTEREPYSIIMNLYEVDGFTFTIHDVLSTSMHPPNSKSARNVAMDSVRTLLDHDLWINVLLNVVKGIEFMHKKFIIHRDLKTDNIVIYNQLHELKPVIIDFGKSQPVSAARKYTLSEEQKSTYRTSHGHIAPDLIDGVNKPSCASDMYSYGRIFKTIIQYFPLSKETLPTLVVKMVKDCLKYDPLERPTATTVIQCLS